MTSIVKCKGKSRKFAKAVLSKYGQKVTPSIFVFDKKTVLNAALEEIEWCKSQGLDIKLEIVEVGTFARFFIGSL